MSFADKIRSNFLEFFQKNGHFVEKSSSVVPQNDPTLLFTNSGMVQFKDIFTGVEQTTKTRVCTSQKSIRAGGKHNDLDNVGYTNRHHTFFEMLGNFSFDDYFKQGAIEYAWEFLTQNLCIDKNRLYITVFHNDDEAFEIWRKLTGFGSDRILRITTKDNFWSMGDVGPCGPCSEIFYDYGPDIFGGLPGTDLQDGPRYTEIWNLVFMQFEQKKTGEQILLPKKNIDTGMGLERLLSVLENKTDNYETSLFCPIIDFAKHLCQDIQDAIALRIASDHARSAVFIIADGILPSNDGRGYVLRRIIRRALKTLYLAGVKDGIFAKLCDFVINIMGSHYFEIVSNRDFILSQIADEEARFLALLPRGIGILNEQIAKTSGKTLSGDVAFMLYDTFGFPLDLTVDIAKKNGLDGVDVSGFEDNMRVQQNQSKGSLGSCVSSVLDEIFIKIANEFGSSDFCGYDDGNLSDFEIKDFKVFDVNGEWFLCAKKTPFYPEGGGQACDYGLIGEAKVLDVFRIKDVIFHKIDKRLDGNVIHVANVFKENRDSNRRPHSATHVLHYFLRKKFGNSLVQKGSSVKNDWLRFDFAKSSGISFDELNMLEREINDYIHFNSFETKTALTSPEDAFLQGAIGLFGEKYGNEVRVVFIGDSVELCGGTHVESVKDIGLFKIISESSIASGIRRIEAVVGKKALDLVLTNSSEISLLKSRFKTDDIESFINRQQAKIKDIEKLLVESKVKIIMQSKFLRADNLLLIDVRDESFSFDEMKMAVPRIVFEDGTLLVIVCSSGVLIASKTGLPSAQAFCQKIMQESGLKGGGSKNLAFVGGKVEIEKILNCKL